MNKIILLALSFVSLTAYADLTTQMSRIVGDWRSPDSGLGITRVSQQSSNEIAIYGCNTHDYYNGLNYPCNYSKLQVAVYRTDLDAFYVAYSGEQCSASLQVSVGSNTILISNDPYAADGNCADTGQSKQMTKLR